MWNKQIRKEIPKGEGENKEEKKRERERKERKGKSGILDKGRKRTFEKIRENESKKKKWESKGRLRECFNLRFFFFFMKAGIGLRLRIKQSNRHVIQNKGTP